MAGTLSGKVIDIRNNQAIDGASLEAEPGSHTTTTAGDGAWSMSVPANMAPGYSLTVTKDGYAPWIAQDIVVLDDIDTNLTIALHPADD